MASVTGKINRFLDKVEGESNGRYWVRQSFVLQIEDDRLLCFTCFGEDKVELLRNLELDQIVVVEYRPQSRTVDDKWYTELRCTRILKTRWE